MSDAVITRPEKVTDNNDIHTQLLSDATSQPGSKIQSNPQSANDAHVASGVLPSLTIDQHSGSDSSWWSGAKTVTKDVAAGAYNEITEHPGRVAEKALIGVGIGVAATLASPEVLTVAAVGGAAYMGYQLGSHIEGWYDDAKVVSNAQDYSAADQAKATADLKNVGAGGVDMAAGIGGAVAGGYLGSALESAAGGDTPLPKTEGNPNPNPNPNANDAPPPDSNPNGDLPRGNGGSDAPSTPKMTKANGGAAAIANNGGQPPAVPGDMSHASTLSGGTAQGDTPDDTTPSSGLRADAPKVTDAPKVLDQPKAADVPKTEDAPKPAEPAGDATKAAPEAASPEQAMADSIKNSQALFNAAKDDGGSGVIPSTKQLYNVRFDKVTDDAGQKIFTLENRTAGVVVPKDSFIATRLDASGNPVVEDGITNNWSMKAPKILSTYQVNPDTLDDNSTFVAATRTDAPPVHMVKLDGPTQIMTKWGPMSGNSGDYLANYDYNAATGTPGQDYAIVTGTSYAQTYQPVDPKSV